MHHVASIIQLTTHKYRANATCNRAGRQTAHNLRICDQAALHDKHAAIHVHHTTLTHLHSQLTPPRRHTPPPHTAAQSDSHRIGRRKRVQRMSFRAWISSQTRTWLCRPAVEAHRRHRSAHKCGALPLGKGQRKRPFPHFPSAARNRHSACCAMHSAPDCGTHPAHTNACVASSRPRRTMQQSRCTRSGMRRSHAACNVCRHF